MIINGEHANHLEFTDAVALGDGVFETLRSYGGQVFALTEHLARLQEGLEHLGISDFDIEQLRIAVAEILKSESLEVGAIRISVYSDRNWVVSHKPYSPPQQDVTCTLKEVPVRGMNYKSASYGERLELRRAAQLSGFDDVILMDSNQEVKELSTSNLILHIDGRWQTPHLTGGVLPGITRKILIANFGLAEMHLQKQDLVRVNSLAAISSLREIQGIKAIDGKHFPISNELRELQVSFHHWILGNLAL